MSALVAHRNMAFGALALMAIQHGCQPAHTQQLACAPYASVKKNLSDKYHEEPIGGGVVNKNTIVQVFASPDGATWTWVAIGSNGTACIAGVGTGWEPGKLPVKEDRT